MISAKNKKKAFLLLWILLLVGCSDQSTQEVVVYTSVDQIFSEPVFQQFSQQTGIRVKPVYDVEAVKAVGLEKRLLIEQKKPRADVFWNSEYLRTLRLAQKNVFASYTTQTNIPDKYRSLVNQWIGFGLRARVFVVNTDLVSPEKMPNRLTDLTDIKWQGKIAIAKPYFGTTATHFAALYLLWGEKQFVDFLQQLKANDVAILPGNSNVRDAVVSGRYAFGLTDTDDVNVALRKNVPVKMIYLDQDKAGSFTIFHTVALIKGAPHQEMGQRFIDYLVQKQVEQTLQQSGAIQFSVRSSTNTPKLWHTTSATLLQALPRSTQLMRQHLD